MSKKPKKKKQLNCSQPNFVNNNADALYGYNQAIDECEKFLPRINEIEFVLTGYIEKMTENYSIKDLAKAISKRIRGKR